MNKQSFFDLNYRKQINNFFLQFKDEKIDQVYKKYTQIYQKQLFTVIVCCFIILLVATFIYNGFIKNRLTIAVGAISTAGFQLLMLLGSQKYPAIIKINTFLLSIINIFLFVELYYYYLQNLEEDQLMLAKQYFSIGTYFAFIMIIWSQLINEWYYRTLYIIFQIEYFVFRVYEINGYQLFVCHITVLLMLPLVFYLQEKFDIINFYNLYSQKQDLLNTQCLVIKAISSSIFVTTQQNHNIQCIYANENCYKEFNITNQQDIVNIIQKTSFSLLEQQEKSIFIKQLLVQEEFMKSLQHVLIEVESNQLNQQIHQKDDKKIELRCQVKLPHQQSITQYLIKIVDCIWEQQLAKMTIIENISDQYQNKLLRQLDKYKDNLLATVTHDLKTPLNCIIAFSQQAIQQMNINDVKKNIHIIIKNAQLQKYLIGDILDFSQYKNNQLRLNFSKFLFQDVLNEILEMFQDQASQKNITLQKHMLNCEGIEIHSDICRIKQIFINLISNALKYTIKGSITILIEKLVEKQELNEIELIKCSVIDTGVGIPDEIKSQLCKKYKTFNHTSQLLNQNGIGLGLIICKKLIKKLGPNKGLDIESQVQLGSTFTFYLYSKNLQQQEQFKQNQSSNQFENAIIKSQEGLENNECSKLIKLYQFQYKNQFQIIKQNEFHNVLLVDDNFYNIMALQVIMQNYTKIKLFKADNGQQAYDIIQKDAKDKKYFKLIITDINMPIMNGIDLIKNIRQFEQKNQISNCIIAVLSADEFEENINSILKLGANEILKKPVSYEAMNNMLKLYNLI